MRRITSRLAIAALAVTLSTQSATAQPYTYDYSGTTVGGPRWARPKIDFYGGSSAVPYSAFGFSVYRTGTHSFLSEATSWDNYLYLYEAADDGNYLLIQNDDLNGTAGLSGFDFVLDRNKVYHLVTTGYQNIDAGVFSNSITGPSEYVFDYCCFQLPESTVPEPTVPESTVPESTVPEPSTYALMAAGLLALGVTARKRRATA